MHVVSIYIYNSYRPINNLATLEKIIEQHLKLYLCTNNIIIKNHHDYRKYPGANAVFAHITNEINTHNCHKGNGFIYCFDTINNVKLINKLHMALKGTSLKCSDHSCPKVLNMYKPTRLIPNHLSHSRI